MMKNKALLFPQLHGAEAIQTRRADGSIWMGVRGATDETHLNFFCRNQETADVLAAEINQVCQQPQRREHPAQRPPRVKLTAENKHSIRRAWLACDRDRAARYYELTYALNVMLRAVVTLFDDCVDNFDADISQSLAQAVKNAEKSVTRLLDAAVNAIYLDEEKNEVINEHGRTKADETQAALDMAGQWVAERLRILIPHAMIYVQRGDEWRLEEIDKVINRILPMEVVDKKRDIMYQSTRQLVLEKIERDGKETE